MGFINDSPSSTTNTTNSPALSTITDEEILGSADGRPPPYHHPRKHSRHTSLSNPRTPTARNNGLLHSARHGRSSVTESEEIWEELEDDTLSPLLSPFHQRRASARSTPSRELQRPRSGAGAPASPSESTALLGRTDTGRSYRDRRRRQSAPHLESLRRPQAQGRRRASVQQDALGGWWNMRWWRKESDDGDRLGEEG